MSTSSTCGAKRSIAHATMGFSLRRLSPLSTPPMRRPRPPARTTPVTPTLREHRRTDGGFEEALLSREEQVVLVDRAAEHGDADLRCDAVAHLGESRARDEERDLHLRGLDHHFGGEAPGRVEDLVGPGDVVEPHESGDR